MSLRACMGGWCNKREKCAHYHAYDRRAPIERMCQTDGHESWVPCVQGVGDMARSFIPIQVARPLLQITEIAS